MTAAKRIVLVGAGGHASDVLACLEAINSRAPAFVVVGAVDDDPTATGDRLSVRGVAILGSVEQIGDFGADYVIAVGSPRSRLTLVERLQRLKNRPVTLVHPTAEICAGTEIGAGSVIVDGVHVSALCRIGRHVYLGHHVVVGHDTTVGDGCSLMPGSVIAGGVRLGRGTLVGSNATVLEGRAVGDSATVGAGAVVTRDVPDGLTVVGAPARPTTA